MTRTLLASASVSNARWDIVLVSINKPGERRVWVEYTGPAELQGAARWPLHQSGKWPIDWPGETAEQTVARYTQTNDAIEWVLF